MRTSLTAWSRSFLLAPPAPTRAALHSTSRPTTETRRTTASVVDVVLPLVLFLIGFTVYFSGARRFNPDLFHGYTSRDIWFDGDITRVVNVAQERSGGDRRTSLHPLHAYIEYTGVRLIRPFVANDWVAALRAFHALFGGLWIAGLYGISRRLRLRPADGVLVAALGGSCAAAVFWFTVPESFSIAAVAMLATFWILTRPDPGGASNGAWIASTAAALGITVTNGMAPGIGAVASMPLRRAIRIGLWSVIIVGGLYVLEKHVFPSASTSFGKVSGERRFFYMPEAGGRWAATRAFFWHSMVAPRMNFLPNWRMPRFPYLSVQSSPLFSGDPWNAVATVSWTALFGLAIVALWDGRAWLPLRATVGLAIAGQFFIHIAYGKEAFLYSLHYAPFFVVAVAIALQSRLRAPVLALAAVFVVSNAVNNVRAFAWAAGYTQRKPAILAWQKRHPVDLYDSFAKLRLSSERTGPPAPTSAVWEHDDRDD